MVLRIGSMGGALPHREENPLSPSLTPVEVFVRQFPKELTRLSTLAGMAAGGLAFRLARCAVLGWAGQVGVVALRRGFSGRIFSAAAGTLVEAPLFNGVAGMVDRVTGSPASAAHGNDWQSTAATATMLASLRVFGFLGHKTLGLAKALSMGKAAETVAGPSILTTFQVAGLHYSYQLEKKLGWVDLNFSDPTLTDHLASVAQFTGVGMVLRGALGARWVAMERVADKRMELNLQQPKVEMPLGPQLAWEGGLGLNLPSKTVPSKKFPPYILAMEKSEAPGPARGAAFPNGPAISASKKVFPWTFPGEAEDTWGGLYLEHGSQKDLSQMVGAREQMLQRARQVRELFSPNSTKASKMFSGPLGAILNDYPGLLWGIRHDLAKTGHKLWIQVDADKESLWSLLLLDGFNRPRYGLMTLPYGTEVLETRIDYHASGLPNIQGTFFSLDPLRGGKVTALPINRVSYDGVWEEKLDHPTFQQQLFQKKNFTISLFHKTEIPVAIQYSMEKSWAKWAWNVLPLFGPMLHLETRYEEYRHPTAKALKEAQQRPPKPPKTNHAPPAPPRPKPAVEPAPETKPVDKQEKALEPKGEKKARPKVRFEPSPFHGDEGQNIRLHLKKIEEGAPGGRRGQLQSLKAVYYQLLRSHHFSEFHLDILESIPAILDIPYYGPGFVTHYGRMLAPNRRMEVLSKVLPVLSSDRPLRRAAAFEVVRYLSPILEVEERQRLLSDMERRFGKERAWGQVVSMIYQARRALESPSRTKLSTLPLF